MPRYLPAPELPAEVRVNTDPNLVPCDVMFQLNHSIRNAANENGTYVDGTYRYIKDHVVPKWMVRNKEEGKTGSLLRRLKSACAAMGTKLTDKQWSEIGQEIAGLKTTKGGVIYHVSEYMDWEPGEYGDAGSCFWGGRDQARGVLEQRMRARFILGHVPDESGELLGNSRCIAIPLSAADIRLRGWSLINYYGAGGRQDLGLTAVAETYANAMGLQFKHQVPTEFSGGGTGLLYLNNGYSSVIADEKSMQLVDRLLKEEKPRDTWFREVARGGYLTLSSGIFITCACSGEWVPKSETVEVQYSQERTRRVHREALQPPHFSECTRCGSHYAVRDEEYHDEPCRHAGICYECESLIVSRTSLLANSEESFRTYLNSGLVRVFARIERTGDREWVYRKGRRGSRVLTVDVEKLKPFFGDQAEALVAN